MRRLLGLTLVAAAACGIRFTAIDGGGGAAPAVGGGGTTTAGGNGGHGGAAGNGGGAHAGGQQAGGQQAGGSGGEQPVGGSGGAVSTIDCAGEPCFGEEVCCITAQTPPNTVQSCVGPLACSGLPVSRDGVEDCPGTDVCCGTFDSNANEYEVLSCLSSCEPPHRPICHLAGPVCPTDKPHCKVSAWLPTGWGWCDANP